MKIIYLVFATIATLALLAGTKGTADSESSYPENNGYSTDARISIPNAESDVDTFSATGNTLSISGNTLSISDSDSDEDTNYSTDQRAPASVPDSTR